ncbi:glycosyltransferase family 1 protein [Arthrobacter sp. KBS0702]|uniref:glycosyltransferase family 4 protein n=1 Tax=Arthrobacter sp. KBS0702 TaxID=2578107 RepID=UPI00110ED73A|nr:glycosyltransferase family 1 protein [Arthrobacter sp. KBS0702]QDW29042.1 glycosyltransferase family 1 protein [Arthrobacter sp. KBS0702]
MRIALVAESFLPQMNGVTHSILRVLEHLQDRGDEVLVIAPSTQDTAVPGEVHGAQVHRLPSVPLAGYTNVRVALGGVARVKRILADYAPDVVHLASPFVLGWRAAQAAHQLGIPSVAIYQTEVPGYAARYGVPFLENWAWNRVDQIHLLASRTLVPSTFALNQFLGRGIPRVQMWRRGVDTARFSPAKRDAAWRAAVAPGGERIIGYVGRLAVEKQVQDLAVLADVPGTKLVIVGDGPQRDALEAALPQAVFTGFLGGEELARAVASFDLFVHPGEFETFCQTIQEAMASGVPVVATGRGGPLDLVENSRTGWLYPPGDLAALRARVTDLTGDDAKRRAFAAAAHASVQGRTWHALGEELVLHYQAALARPATPGPSSPTPTIPSPTRGATL